MSEQVNRLELEGVLISLLEDTAVSHDPNVSTRYAGNPSGCSGVACFCWRGLPH